jgi:hypothetical protein
MVEFGSSPSLDEDFDLIVDDTGDIQCTIQEQSPSEELEKDLSFLIAASLDKQTGNAIIPVNNAALKGAIRDVVIADPRVDQILTLELEQAPRTDDEDGNPSNEVVVDLTIRDNAASTAQDIELTI